MYLVYQGISATTSNCLSKLSECDIVFGSHCYSIRNPISIFTVQVSVFPPIVFAQIFHFLIFSLINFLIPFFAFTEKAEMHNSKNSINFRIEFNL